MKKDYHINLANYFQTKPLYLDGEGFKKPNVRKLVEQPWQELEAAKAIEKQFKTKPKIKEQREKLWDNVTNTLCNLDFIQAKAAAKLTYELVNEINKTLEFIPDNAKEIAQEKTHQARMDKYTQDLIACAKGKITRFELEVPESITPWTEEQINDEIERIKTNPNRADRLKDFRNFLGQEADNLQNYAHEFAHFAIQQAWNYANEGPVGNSASNSTNSSYKYLINRKKPNRQIWKPIPSIVKILNGHSDSINSIAISIGADKALTSGKDKKCFLWDLKTGDIIKTLKLIDDEIWSINFSYDSKQAICFTTKKTCIIWNLITGLINTIDNCQVEWNSPFAISSNTILSRTSNNNTCVLRNLFTGEEIRILSGHSKRIRSVSMTPDSKLGITASEDKTCIIWDLTTGESIYTFNSYIEYIHAVYITPNGKKAYAGSSAIWIEWDIISGIELNKTDINDLYTDQASFSLDGHFAITMGDTNKNWIWNTQNQKIHKTISWHSNAPVQAIDISSDGRSALIGDGSGKCILWDLTIPDKEQNSDELINIINSIYLEEYGKVGISFSFNKNCSIWDPNTLQKLYSWKFEGHIHEIIGTQDGKRIIFNSFREFKIYNLKRNQIEKTIPGKNTIAPSSTIAPSGRFFLRPENADTILWDIYHGLEVKNIKGMSGRFTLITPDGKIGVFDGRNNEGEGLCIVVDLIKDKIIHNLKGHLESILCLSLTQDGKIAISGSFDKTCRVWDLRKGQLLRTFTGHNDIVTSINILPNGKLAISCSFEKTILWEINTGKILGLYVGHHNIENISSIPAGFLGKTSNYEIVFLNLNKELLGDSLPIANISRIWDHQFEAYMEPKTDCPICGNRFKPSRKVFKSIKKINRKNKLKSFQSPCLELPDEDWEEPGLLSECPKCEEGLKFNPFIAGGEDFYEGRNSTENENEVSDEHCKDLKDDNQIYDGEINKEKATVPDVVETTIKEESKGLSTDTIVIIIAVILSIIFGYYFFKN